MKRRTFFIFISLAAAAISVACSGDDATVIVDEDKQDAGNADADVEDPNFNSSDPGYEICGAGDITIEGKVTDEAGEPVVGARVHVGGYRERFDFDDEFQARCTGALTRDDGTYTLVDVNEHDELLRAIDKVGGGHEPYTKSEAFVELDLEAGQTVEEDLELEVTQHSQCGDPNGATLKGTVYRSDTTSTAATARISMKQFPECGTTAGTGGVFTIEDIPADYYNVTFTQGRWRGEAVVEVEEGEVLEDLEWIIPTE